LFNQIADVLDLFNIWHTSLSSCMVGNSLGRVEWGDGEEEGMVRVHRNAMYLVHWHPVGFRTLQLFAVLVRVGYGAGCLADSDVPS
jgi:hypothetical protein